jgi:hypothetical protein
MLVILFVIKGLFTKNSSWQAKQSIPHTFVTVYGDCVKICEDSAPNFGDNRTGCCITTSTVSHFQFTREFLTQNNVTVLPHPPYFSLFSRLKIKLKGRHFDTIEVIEAESQKVLITLTEHDFQDAFKNGRSAGNGVYIRPSVWCVPQEIRSHVDRFRSAE